MKLARTLLAACVLALAGATTASAATIKVTTTKDQFGSQPKKCSLREAIQAANTNARFGGCAKGKGADRIVLKRGVYRLTRTGSDDDNASGDLDINGPVAIAGKGEKRTVIDGNGERIKESVFHVITGRARFAGMTIRNGFDDDNEDGGAIDHVSPGALTLVRMRFVHNAADYLAGAVYHYNLSSNVTIERSKFIENDSAYYGGGFYSDGAKNVKIRNSLFKDNSADYAYGGGIGVNGAVGKTVIARTRLLGNVTDYDYGGGLYLDSDEGAALSKLTVVGNTSGAYSSGYGGGIYTYDTDVTLRDSTIAGNVSSYYGGGIYAQAGSLKLINSTVSRNHASNDSGYGGGIYADGPVDIRSSTIVYNRAYVGAGIYEDDPVTYKNSIIARNRELYAVQTQDCYSGSPGSSLGHNFFGDDTCDASGPGDIASGTYSEPANPLVEALGNNGGPTPTHALLRGSPAIDKGKGCPKRDQRGHKRKGKCDIGAFER